MSDRCVAFEEALVLAEQYRTIKTQVTHHGSWWQSNHTPTEALAHLRRRHAAGFEISCLELYTQSGNPCGVQFFIYEPKPQYDTVTHAWGLHNKPHVVRGVAFEGGIFFSCAGVSIVSNTGFMNEVNGAAMRQSHT